MPALYIQILALSAMIRQIKRYKNKVSRKYYTFYGNKRKYLKLHMEDDTMTAKGTSGIPNKKFNLFTVFPQDCSLGRQNDPGNEVLRYVKMYQEFCK